MKKYYKVVSLALAGAITTSSLVSMPVEAEENVVSDQDLQEEISQEQTDAQEMMQESDADIVDSESQETLNDVLEFETPIDVEALTDSDAPVVYSPEDAIKTDGESEQEASANEESAKDD